MNKKVFRAATIVLLSFLLTTIFCSCNRKPNEAEKLSDEQMLSGIMNYCYTQNPDLKSIVEAKEYPVYWEISSSDEHETVVLFRSYTGAQNRYYIDQTTGDTYVTEFVPGITAEEQQTDESFNIRDYLSTD